MQIIDIGECINNIDPKGIGRIRFKPYSSFVSELTMGIDYKEWDNRDPFVAIPFLPAHINIIPRIQQSIKIIRYDTDKETQNIEYIAGPYSSPHDLQTQTFTSQHKNTTYGGVVVKDLKDIRNKDGKFNSPVTPGAMIDEKDTGFRGNYGSDIIFTENGLQLRGGSLLSKQGKNKDSILNYPQLAKKMGRINLKKFSTTGNAVQETITVSTIAVSKIKYIIEYEIDSLTSPSVIALYVYKVVGGYGTLFNTNVFGENSVLSTTNSEVVRQITGDTYNLDNDIWPDLHHPFTFVHPLAGTIKDAYINLRELLYEIDSQGLKTLDNTYPDEDIYPFYYRPTEKFRLTQGANTTEISNKATFLSKIQIRNRIGSSGLIYSRQNVNPPITDSTKTIDSVQEVRNGGEQSFGNLSADKIYITSTSPNVGVNVKKINFNELDEYELTQDDYLSKIEPNTYAMVRGENLYNFLVAVKNLLDSHIHQINEPLVQADPNWVKLNELLETLRNDLLNDSIRIN